MKLPNLSYMMSVGQLRYIQSVYEVARYRNPDTLVRDFLPRFQKWGCDLRGRALLSRSRSKPFYFYVLARTIYYDMVFFDAMEKGFNHIVNIGCGTDTRAYRFGHILSRTGIQVIECDQPQAIHTKQKIASKSWPVNHVKYLPIDLNNELSWSQLMDWLRTNRESKVLVMMEGVSPYVDESSFAQFLKLLSSELYAGSEVSYDFKVTGVADDFGSSDLTKKPFRLPNERKKIESYHQNLGYQVKSLESSADLTLRMLPEFDQSAYPIFLEEVLLRLVR